MTKTIKLLLFAAAALTLVGCTDAGCSSVTAYGSAANVKCYSGGKIIYDGKSTGRIATVDGSDGWEFREAGSKLFIRVSGDCVIIN